MRSLLFVALSFVSTTVLAESAKLKELPEDSKLVAALNEILENEDDCYFGDCNITSGKTSASLWTVTKPVDKMSVAELKQLESDAFAMDTFYNDDAEYVSKTKFTQKVYVLSGSDIKSIAAHIAESNDFDPRGGETVKEISVTVRKIVKALKEKKDTRVIVAMRRGLVKRPEDAGGNRYITQYLLINAKTNNVLRLYLIEGHM